MSAAGLRRTGRLHPTKKRFLFIPLLLPLLALSAYDIDQLIYKLPSYSDAQEILRDNYHRSRELDTPPTAETIIAKLDRVDHTDDALIAFDEDALREELNGADTTQQSIKPDQVAKTNKIRRKVHALTKKIRQTDAQSKRIRKALRDTRFISALSFGISDKHVTNKLNAGLKQVKKRRKSLISQRNAARAALSQFNLALQKPGEIKHRLYRLDAAVETYLWASQSLESWRISRVYGFISFLVLLVIIGRFSMGSWIYLSTLSASLVVSMLYVEGPLAFRWWTIISFVLASLVLRVLYLACVENYPLIRRQSREFMLRTSAITFLYYLPFIALILAGAYLSYSVQRGIDTQLYASEWVNDSDPDRKTRRYDIDIGIDAYFAKREQEALRNINKVSTSGSEAVQNIASGVVKAFETTFPPNLGPAFRVTRCPPLEWVLQTANCVQKEVKYSLNKGYSEIRADQLRGLKKSARAYTSRAGKIGQKAAAIAKQDLSENLLAIRLSLKQQLGHLYATIDFYSGLMLIALTLAILKSLLYIFARIFFASEPEDADRKIQFEPNLQPAQQGSVREVSERLELTASLGKQMFVNKHLDFANAPPDEVTPQAHKALFSRFINGVWHMNQIQIPAQDQPDNPPYRRLPADERIVTWTLKPGDAVIFSWKDFVGMNETVQIRTQYSWQLSSLVFGRMFFVVASVAPDAANDGCLLLSARGSDGCEPSDNSSNSPDQLLAWQTTTRFQLHANLTLRNIYRSGIQIRAVDSELAVMHLNQRKRKSGAAGFLKYFIVPV